MIKGTLVNLFAIEVSDLNQILEWRNSEELRVNFREHKELSNSQQTDWFNRINGYNLTSEYNFSIRLRETNDLIGVAGVNHINWIDRNCQLSLFIGKDLLYIDEMGWANESLQLLIRYAQNTLNLNKIYVEIYEFDKRKIDLLKFNKFKLEGELKKHVFKNGKYHSSFIYSLIRKDQHEF